MREPGAGSRGGVPRGRPGEQAKSAVGGRTCACPAPFVAARGIVRSVVSEDHLVCWAGTPRLTVSSSP